MDHKWLDDYCFGKLGSNKEFKEQWQATLYSVGGKMFALLGENKDFRPIISLKLIPSGGDYWRQQYKGDIVPGYYLNKVHWNSVCLDASVPVDIIKDLIDRSYELIFSSLTKKKQKKILELSDHQS
ncbi:MAG: MmcQ/YjbR family DNA-binding protein [Deltaproteobacteria bacterium]|jgi:predicted DNA-binding protein (MmcQ/YjbR family)|nr:MmcQ/YjbR family DNA-binding protein [Deltaproteobacteria bacterium]